MPSTSDERRGRVVTDTDSVRSSALSCVSMRVSVVLPAPEGEDRIRIMPRRLRVIVPGLVFDWLRLLAALLDLRPQFKPPRSSLRTARACRAPAAKPSCGGPATRTILSRSGAINLELYILIHNMLCQVMASVTRD